MTEPAPSASKISAHRRKTTCYRSFLMAASIGQGLGSLRESKDRRTGRPRITPFNDTGCTAFSPEQQQRG